MARSRQSLHEPGSGLQSPTEEVGSPRSPTDGYEEEERGRAGRAHRADGVTAQ